MQCVSPFPKPQVEKGVIDFRSYDFSHTGNASLRGNWEFYWGKLYTPANIPKAGPNNYFQTPISWNTYLQDKKPVGGSGYATYQLKILLPSNKQNLALKIPNIGTAYTIYVNGELSTQGGIVGQTPETTKPLYKPTIITLPKISDSLNLVIQVANFHHSYGGIWYDLLIGQDEDIRRESNKSDYAGFALLGSILIMGFYHLGLFWVKKTHISALYFGLFCLTSVIRILFEGEHIVRYLLVLDWFTSIRLEYISMPLAVIVFGWFLHSLFPKELPKKMVVILSIISLIPSVFILFFPPLLFTQILLLIELILVTNSIYAVIVLIVATYRKKEGAALLLGGFIILFMALVHDILYTNGIIQSTNQFATGLFIFILSQAQVLSYRFSKAFTKTEQLSQALDDANQNLESIVASRTESLRNANKKLDQESIKLNKSLQAAQVIQRAILPPEQKLNNRFANQYFIIYKPKDIVSGDFYWINDTQLTDLRTAFVAVVDCTGHGVPGALMSMLGNSFLNEIINQQQVRDTPTILRLLNEKVKKNLDPNSQYNLNQGMDVCLCRLEQLSEEATKVVFTGSKIPLFYTSGNNKIHCLKSDRITIGDKQQTNVRTFTTQQIVLNKGDMLYLATDGFTDTPNPQRKSFGSRRFKTLLESICHLSLEEQQQIMLKTLIQYQKGAEQRDDITVLGIRV